MQNFSFFLFLSSLLLIKQGDWRRFAYPVQRSYGISVDEWSDQPLVPALVFLSVWQGSKPRTPTTEFDTLLELQLLSQFEFNLDARILSQSDLFSTHGLGLRFIGWVSGGFRFDDISGSDCLLGVPPIDHLRSQVFVFLTNLHVYRTQFLMDLFKDPS